MRVRQRRARQQAHAGRAVREARARGRESRARYGDNVAKLNLSIAVGDYDRMRPLADGSVAIDGVAARFLLLPPEEMFFRAFRHADFDVCELSLSSFAVRTARRDNPYIGIPCFPRGPFGTPRLSCGAIAASSRPRISRAVASAHPSISSPPASGRAESSRMTTACGPKTSSGCVAGWRIRDGSKKSA